MGPIQPRGAMTHSLPSPSRVSRFTTLLLWRWQHAIGWRIEGPFPNAQEPRLLILGPGLVEGSLWVRFILMRIRFRGEMWHAKAPRPEWHHLLASAEAHSLSDILEWARRHELQIHLVQKNDRHRRLRCNTPIRTERNPNRLRDYVERIFSYSEREERMNPASTQS